MPHVSQLAYSRFTVTLRNLKVPPGTITLLDSSLSCLVVEFIIVLMLMQTRSSGYRSRIQRRLAIKGAIVIKPYLDANSFPALVGHIASHSVSRSLCDLHVQTASSEPLV